MEQSLDRHTAAAIAEQALARVFGAQPVSALREDSPLTAVGCSAADLVCISDAVLVESRSRGWDCVLGDAALGDVATVGDVITAISEHAAPTQVAP